MALATNLQDNASGTSAKVDTAGNLMARGSLVNTRAGGETGAPNYVGAVREFCEVDAGMITGTAILQSPEVSFDSFLQAGMCTPLFNYSFNSTAQDTAAWFHAFTTMTMTTSGGSLLINANSTNTAATGCYLQSKRYFPLLNSAGLRIEFVGTITSTALANEAFYAGLGVPVNSTTVPTDGVWFKLTSGGLFGAVSYNGTLTETSAFAAAPTANTNGLFKITIDARIVIFEINGMELGRLQIPAGNGAPFMSEALPTFIQYFNSGTVTGTSMQVKIGAINVDQIDMNMGKPYPHIQAARGLARQGMNGGTMGSLSFFTNSTNPTTALPVNTALTANLPNLMQGGIGLATLWNLAATDMIMHQAVVPAGTVNQTARTMIITGVRITAVTATAALTAPAAGAHVLLWQIGFGGTATSLATAETGSFVTASTKLHRRVPIGSMTWATGTAPAGTPPDRGDLVATFTSPIVVNPGEFITTICRMFNGAATATGALLFTVDYDHYFQ